MHTRSQKKAKLAARIVTYFVLIAAAVICLFPFIWMISTSFKPMSDIYKMPPTLFPENGTVENFVEGWKGANFQLYFKNTRFWPQSGLCSPPQWLHTVLPGFSPGVPSCCSWSCWEP